MSVQAMTWVLEHSPTQGTDRLVLLCIANHAGSSQVDGAWEAWPGVKLIRHEARLNRERTVQEALARLEAAGHIERVLNGAPDSRMRADRRPTLYRILLTNGVPLDGIPLESDGVPPDDERGAASRQNGVPPDDMTGCRETAPKPSLNQELEPSWNRSLPSPQARASRLPEDFMVSFEMAQWARGEFPHVDLRLETEKFRDYWRSESGAKARKLDWTAAWRNWIRKAGERRVNGNGHAPVSKLQQSQANIAAWAAANREH